MSRKLVLMIVFAALTALMVTVATAGSVGARQASCAAIDPQTCATLHPGGSKAPPSPGAKAK